MAVVDVRPNLSSAPQVGSLDERAQRNYVVTWFVETDDPHDGIQVVGDAPGLPNLGDVYIFGNDRDTGSRCKGKTPRRVPGTQTVWEVEIEYDSRLHPDQDFDRDPTMRRPTKRWNTVRYEGVAAYDVFGNPIENSAHDAFDPPAERDRVALGLSITRFESVFQANFAFTYLDCVNSDSFYGFAPEEARMVDVQSEEFFDNNGVYAQTSYTIHFRKTITSPNVIFDAISGDAVSQVPPWNLTLLDIGYYEVSAGGKKIRITDSKGKPCVTPFRLDGSGNALRPLDAPSSSAFYRTWKIYESKRFADLGLP